MNIKATTQGHLIGYSIFLDLNEYDEFKSIWLTIVDSGEQPPESQFVEDMSEELIS